MKLKKKETSPAINLNINFFHFNHTIKAGELNEIAFESVPTMLSKGWKIYRVTK